MNKLDLTQADKAYYTARALPGIIHIGPTTYLSVQGVGDPDSGSFARDIQALYAVAYPVKFIWKEQGRDFVVPKLEGLWSFDREQYPDVTIDTAPQIIPRSEWQYELLIRLPGFVNEQSVVQGMESARKKKPGLETDRVQVRQMHEGSCIQILHVGPFNEEPESLRKLETFMQEQGWVHNGPHHEIYLSDFRKTAPGQLRTILREPVRRVIEDE